MNAETGSNALDEAAIVCRVRESVQALLGEGAAPSALSYALAFVATELGLALAPNPANVFPVVLSAVSHAAAQSEAGQDPPSDDALDGQGPAAGEMIH